MKIVTPNPNGKGKRNRFAPAGLGVFEFKDSDKGRELILLADTPIGPVAVVCDLNEESSDSGDSIRP